MQQWGTIIILVPLDLTKFSMVLGVPILVDLCSYYDHVGSGVQTERQ